MENDEDDRQFFTEVVAQNNPITILAESHNGQEALHTLDKYYYPSWHFFYTLIYATFKWFLLPAATKEKQ